MDDMDEEDFMEGLFGGAFGGAGGGRRGPANGDGPRQRPKTQSEPSRVELKISLEEWVVGSSLQGASR